MRERTGSRTPGLRGASRLRSATRSRLSATFLLVLGVAAASGAAAQNLINNPDFSQDLSGWTAIGSEITWIADDSETGSGSMEVSVLNVGPNFEQGWAESNCFEVKGGALYEASGWLRADDVFPVRAVEWILYWFDNGDCGGAPISSERNMRSNRSGEWEFREENELVAPAGAMSSLMRAMVFVDAEPGDSSAVAGFDAVFVPEASATPIALACVATLAGLRRARRNAAGTN
jgi:hypothetical protein